MISQWTCDFSCRGLAWALRAPLEFHAVPLFDDPPAMNASGASSGDWYWGFIQLWAGPSRVKNIKQDKINQTRP